MESRGTIYFGDDNEHEKVELFISCRSLKNMDYFSKSDPVVIMYVQNSKTHIFQEFGRTEMIKDNLNPNFATSFQMTFVFEEHQNLKFEVIDIDSDKSFELIGTAEASLGKIMGAKSQLLILDVKNGKAKHGKLIIRGEKIVSSSEVLSGIVKCTKIPSQHWIHKTRPFLKFLKIREDNFQALAFTTEHVGSLNPIFKPFSIPLGRLCDGDHNLPIVVEVWDYSDSGTHHYIGGGTFTIDQLQDSAKRTISLENKKKHHDAGNLHFEQVAIETKPSFVDYIRGGIQLNLITAIDFTASNGTPTNPNSLHFMNPNLKNQYQLALEQVGSILMNYDYDQMVPMYGFGGKPTFPGLNSPNVLHCFPMTGNPSNPEVPGLDGILGCYRESLLHVQLSGPTLFAPLITETMRLAQAIKADGSKSYYGEIHDMDATKSAIVDSAFLPLSIIIIGVGEADFRNMEILDGDDGLVDSRGLAAKRDLVQFVPFAKFKGNPEILAKNVLAELPDQLVEYMKLIGMKPNPPIQTDLNQLRFSSVVQPNQGVPPVQEEVPTNDQGQYNYPAQNQTQNFNSNYGLQSHGY